MKIQLTPEKFLEILDKGYTLDHIYIIKIIDEGFDISAIMKDSAKIAVIHQSLVRKGLIFDNKLSTIGKELLVFVDSKNKKRIIKPVANATEFDTWWETYPRTDTFEYKGKKFTGSRSFRVSKDDCRIKFNKIMLEGEFTSKQMIDAINLEVYQKMEKSFKEGSNKMTYMQNSLTYLNQRTFEGFIELLNSGIKIGEQKNSVRDIDI